jgi:MFS family permease
VFSFSLLKQPDFRNFMLQRFFFVVATQAQIIVIGWQLYALTNSFLLLGLVGLTEAVPAIVCSFFAGHFVDKGFPKRILVSCLVVLSLNMLVMAYVAGGYTSVPQSWIVPAMFFGSFVCGVMRSFTVPSNFSLMSVYVSHRLMPQGQALINTGFQAAVIVGPVIVGFIYAAYGAAGGWAFLVVTTLASLLFSLFLSPVLPSHGHAVGSVFESVRDGWRFVFSNAVILPLMTLNMFTVLFGGAVAMLPAYASQILHVGPDGLGLLRSGAALGSLLMGFYFAVFPLRYLSGRWLLWAVVGFSLCMVGFGFSHVFWLSFVLLFFAGAFGCFEVLTRSGAIQLLTPPHLKGRVSSVTTMFTTSANEIGAFESGVAASLMGLVASVVFGGVASLGVVVTIAFFSPSLRRFVIDTHHDDKH